MGVISNKSSYLIVVVRRLPMDSRCDNTVVAYMAYLRKSTRIDDLIASDQVKVTNLIVEQKVIVTEIEKVLHPMATPQRFLEGQQYATSSLVLFCLWKIRNTSRDTAESNDVSISTNHIAKVLYDNSTKKCYGDGTQIYHKHTNHSIKLS